MGFRVGKAHEDTEKRDSFVISEVFEAWFVTIDNERGQGAPFVCGARVIQCVVALGGTQRLGFVVDFAQEAM